MAGWFPRSSWRALLVPSIASSIAALSCSGSTVDQAVVPRTSITIRARGLAEGRGCGTGAAEVFKYVAVLRSRASGRVLGGRLYDCFADALYVSLDPVDGSYDFDFDVFLYNQAAFQAAGDLTGKAADPTALRATNPTWTTSCRATQLANVESLAQCSPIVPGLGGLGGGPAGTGAVEIAVDAFRLADGTTARCSASAIAADAGADASAGDAGGAGDAGAGAGDAGGDAGDAGVIPAQDGGVGNDDTFTTVRFRTTLAPTTITASCVGQPNNVLRIEPVPAPIVLGIELELVRASGSQLAATTCSATTAANTTVQADCQTPTR